MPRKKSVKPLLLVGDRHREEDEEPHHGGCDDDDDDDAKPPPSDAITCLSLLKHDFSKPVEKLSEAYGKWREERRTSAWRMERQLRARWALDQLIDSELARFDAHFNRFMLPARPRDVGRLLLPPWKLPLENAALSWLGDWRPSAILSLIPVLAANSALLPLSPRALRTLAEAARRIRVHEAVLEEEAAEYQITCVLDLPFGRRGGTGGGRCAGGSCCGGGGGGEEDGKGSGAGAAAEVSGAGGGREGGARPDPGGGVLGGLRRDPGVGPPPSRPVEGPDRSGLHHPPRLKCRPLSRLSGLRTGSGFAFSTGSFALFFPLFFQILVSFVAQRSCVRRRKRTSRNPSLNGYYDLGGGWSMDRYSSFFFFSWYIEEEKTVLVHLQP
ncbi:uncharacterized protein LOC103706499 isoform X2 [Phoenix dactylifera]|uniref:Uncharacterized protein LOC103706499 isoform X2 n=1 Tax=Phoenix dactylifera TaxID=42345 RepID=A0A8B8J418_PHODC|nr:uncharacterized protein LOC103706499 isoform X2 [Phoenix dactylifera]